MNATSTETRSQTGVRELETGSSARVKKGRAFTSATENDENHHGCAVKISLNDVSLSRRRRFQKEGEALVRDDADQLTVV